MGLMDEWKNDATNGESAKHEALAQSLMTSFQTQGGLSGLVNAFHERGLGGVISSWIASGSNQAVSGNQIAQVLGGDRISALASKSGLPTTAVTETLARLLPELVDRMTPNGKLPPGTKDQAA